MRTITSFPPKYPLVKRYVRSLVLPHVLSQDEEDGVTAEGASAIDYGNADFFVELKRGCVYSLLACTPDYVTCYMARENDRSFISPGLVLVRDMTLESVLSVVEECLELGALERVGVLQTDAASATLVETPLVRAI